MSPKLRLRRIGLMLAAPVLALVMASLLVTVLLLALGKEPGVVLDAMVQSGKRPGNIVDIVNRATFLYIAALAVAIGFRMNLFNIGVDGQYRLAAFLAAAVGGAIVLPGPLHILVVLIVAMAVGAAWAGIAAILKVTRGVSEVLSTIMLNAIATAVIAYLLRDGILGVLSGSGNEVGTKPIPESGWFPSLDPIARPIIEALSSSGLLDSDTVQNPKLPASKEVYGFLVVAIILGILYAVLVDRTRFGFDLRATGSSPTAAVASGVSVKRMVLTSMLLSGAVAGLIGMPELLEGRGHNFSLNFPSGIGFTGIAVALLGRNNPIGMALAALLWGWVDVTTRSLAILDPPNDTSDKVASIVQALIVFCVVIAYVVVNRWAKAAEARQVAQELASGHDLSTEEPVPAAVGSAASKTDADASPPATAGGSPEPGESPGAKRSDDEGTEREGGR
ncbi:ABC transporter permease [Cryptosporangium minutisporangium]|uniref:ABC transporter permease n=2 Tax=Cryptosporangium minutisporangium TaxID=113569 RepID=A0ABP6T3B2_9ACTN